MKHEIHSISDTKGRHCGALLYTRQGLTGYNAAGDPRSTGTTGSAATSPHGSRTSRPRTGSVPTIRYFDLTTIVDNEIGSVTEFPPAAAQAAE